jgi:four helix bundle protein
MAGFEELEVWKESRRLRLAVSALCKKFPKSEEYSLISQIKRSARSITANIAEGHGRFHYKENIQFCRHSRGSLEETRDHLITALDENYITNQEYEECLKMYEQCLKLLNGYILYLKRKSEEGEK